MSNYLTKSNGDEYGPRLPFVTDNLEGAKLALISETLTYNGKAVAGAVTINTLASHPVMSAQGDRVASYWDSPENLVYTSNGQVLIGETATSATAIIVDSSRDLEKAYESLTGTVKRFVLKVTDNSGYSLYGWIFGVAVSSNAYTFDIYNARLSEAAKSWVGTLGDFDMTRGCKAEIFRYTSSIAYGTGTTLTEEVRPPAGEYILSWKKLLDYANDTLTSGQWFCDYMRGLIVGKRADTTASETVTYNIASNSNTLETGDLEIGAVELKNAATDDRALISDANTARGATDHVLEVQALDAAGAVLSTSALATAAKQPTLGTGLMAGSAPITLATDDTQFGAVGAASDVDGNVHGQLRYIGEAVDSLPAALGTAAMAASMPVTIASDDTLVTAIKTAVELLDNSVDGNYLNVNMNLAGTDAPSGAGTEAGVLRVTIATDSTGVLSVDDNGSSITVDCPAVTTGGATMWKSLDVDETEDEVKGSAGQIYMIHAMNMKASVLYLKVYNNTAAGVVVGTTVPDWTFPVPTLATTNGAGFVVAFPTGIACGTGITIACTTGFADADAGAPGANEMIVNIAYK